jgi:hypothetical protein
MRNYLPSGRDLVQIGTALLKSACNVTNPRRQSSDRGEHIGGSRRSMGRGVKVAGGQINKARLPQVGESGL